MPAPGQQRWTGQVAAHADRRNAILDAGRWLRSLYRTPSTFGNVGIAGNPSRKSIRNPQVAPTVNYSFPTAGFSGLYPEPNIRWNFGPSVTGQRGRLLLPFDARVGHQFTKALAVSLAGSVSDLNQYPAYDFTTELRIDMKL